MIAMYIRQLYEYLRQAWKWQRKFPGSCSRADLKTFFPRWRHDRVSGANPLDDGSPWLTFGAITFLEDLLTRQMNVFEYGSGGSTIFFSNRAASVVSVEHDQRWAEKVKGAIAARKLENIHLLVRPAQPDPNAIHHDPSELDGYVSTAEGFHGSSFRDYATAIDSFPEESFDVVILDGRARPSCFKHAVSKVKKGGWLLLDNAEREEYRRIHQSPNLGHWRKREFSGPGPYNVYFWQTCAWQNACLDCQSPESGLGRR
jgi:hypothetical protein